MLAPGVRHDEPEYVFHSRQASQRAKVAQGDSRSARDIAQPRFGLVDEQEARLEALRGALMEGENSGPSTVFDFEAFIKSKRGAETSVL